MNSSPAQKSAQAAMKKVDPHQEAIPQPVADKAAAVKGTAPVAKVAVENEGAEKERGTLNEDSRR